MPRKKREPTPQRADATTRPDLLLNAADPSSYIATIERPSLDGNRKKFVLDGFKRGMTPEALLRGSGYDVTTLFKILGLDEVENHRMFERLTDYRKSLTLEK